MADEPTEIQQADRLKRDIENLLRGSSLPLAYKRGILNQIESMLRQREREIVGRERRRSSGRTSG